MTNEYYDDCEVCRAMRLAEERGRAPSQTELLEAFCKQQATGVGVVGFGEEKE